MTPDAERAGRTSYPMWTASFEAEGRGQPGAESRPGPR